MNKIEIKVYREDRGIEYIVNISNCVYEYQVREGLKSALRLGGYIDSFIMNTFNEEQDLKKDDIQK